MTLDYLFTPLTALPPYRPVVAQFQNNVENGLDGRR